MKFVILIIASYLLGSIPFGLIIAHMHGKDLRSIGSGNIGATNVSRALGKKWAYFCFFLDVSKGFLPMFITARFISGTPGTSELWLWLCVGIAAVLGHIFPVYLKFKGGKGVATSFGVALGLWPYFTICSLTAFLVWVIIVLIWRYISLASIVASAVFPVVLLLGIAINTSWAFADLWPLLITAVGIPAIVTVRHIGNIKRMIAGTESKVFSRAKDKSA